MLSRIEISMKKSMIVFWDESSFASISGYGFGYDLRRFFKGTWWICRISVMCISFLGIEAKRKFLALLQADIMTPCKTDSYRSVVAKRLQKTKEWSQNLHFWSQCRDNA